MLLTAWEPVRTRGTTPPAQRRRQAEKTRGRGPLPGGVIEPPPPFYALKQGGGVCRSGGGCRFRSPLSSPPISPAPLELETSEL